MKTRTIPVQPGRQFRRSAAAALVAPVLLATGSAAAQNVQNQTPAQAQPNYDQRLDAFWEQDLPEQQWNRRAGQQQDAMMMQPGQREMLGRNYATVWEAVPQLRDPRLDRMAYGRPAAQPIRQPGQRVRYQPDQIYHQPGMQPRGVEYGYDRGIDERTGMRVADRPYQAQVGEPRRVADERDAWWRDDDDLDGAERPDPYWNLYYEDADDTDLPLRRDRFVDQQRRQAVGPAIDQQAADRAVRDTGAQRVALQQPQSQQRWLGPQALHIRDVQVYTSDPGVTAWMDDAQPQAGQRVAYEGAQRVGDREWDYGAERPDPYWNLYYEDADENDLLVQRDYGDRWYGQERDQAMQRADAAADQPGARRVRDVQYQAGTAADTLEGRIADVQRVAPRGYTGNDTFVRLEFEDRPPVIVNLGPNANLQDIELQRGRLITVRGDSQQFQGQPVLKARSIEVDNQQTFNANPNRN